MKPNSFKEYLISKEILVESLSRTPITTTRYIMKKYCKLPVIEQDQTRKEISLKPKCTVMVECSWPTYQTPLIHSISFLDVDSVDPNTKYTLSWKNEKILNWLDNNTNIDSWLSKMNFKEKEEKEEEND